MRNFENCCFVVEGKTDVAKLSNLIKSNYIITNGSEISKETLSSIKNISKRKDIIIFTDPDFPGKKIRDAVAQVVPNAKHVFVRKEYSIRKNKVGVAEATDEEILKALENIKEFKGQNQTYSLKFLAKPQYFGCCTQEFRDFVSNKLGFEKCNNKRFIKRLNQLEISVEEFDELVREFKYGKN